MKRTLALVAAVLLASCGGGGEQGLTVYAVPSKAQAVWNVSFPDVERIMATCYPNVGTVVVTDVYAGERAHLWVGAALYPTVAERQARTDAGLPPFTGGVDVGDPLAVLNNLPNCPQPAQTATGNGA